MGPFWNANQSIWAIWFVKSGSFCSQRLEVACVYMCVIAWLHFYYYSLDLLHKCRLHCLLELCKAALSRSTDVTSTDLILAKGMLWYSCFDRSILMFLMRERFQCRISIFKHCLMRLWNDINELTFVFPFAITRSINRMWRQLTKRNKGQQ